MVSLHASRLQYLFALELDDLGPRARAYWAHSFVGPKGPGPIGPFLEDSFAEVIGSSQF